MYLSVSMQRELSLKFHRNNVYGHLEQVSRTCVYFHFQITQLVLQTCSKCPYTLFLWKFNYSSLCIGNERYICTTICKHTMNSGLCRIFGKFRGNSCGEMKPLRVMSIHKSVCVTSLNDVLTEARGRLICRQYFGFLCYLGPSIKWFMASHIRLY